MPPRNKYTDPKLRDQVKKDVQNSDKGGAPGQWSARKAQFMASEYKKRGGGYTTDKETGQDESQEHLSKWTEEDWQTKEGSGNAKKSDGTQKRYLPKDAWQNMNEDEKEETEDKKQKGSKQGKQYVGNTKEAKEARKAANDKEDKDMNREKGRRAQGGESNADESDDTEELSTNAKGKGKGEGKGGQKTSKGAKSTSKKESESGNQEDEILDGDAEFVDDGTDDDAEDQEHDSSGDEEEQTESEPPPRGQKRRRNGKSAATDESQKKQKSNSGGAKKPAKANEKTVGSKHDSAKEPAPAGSKSRLPKVGQRVSWKALPGWVHGEVLEIVKSDKSVQGKRIKGSKEEPRIALKTDSGKIAGHKPDAVHF